MLWYHIGQNIVQYMTNILFLKEYCLIKKKENWENASATVLIFSLMVVNLRYKVFKNEFIFSFRKYALNWSVNTFRKLQNISISNDAVLKIFLFFK